MAKMGGPADFAEPRRLVVPARHGLAVRLREGDRLKVVNPNGTQAVDLWAFASENPVEYSAMEHTRSVNSNILLITGLSVMSSERRPMLTLLEDTSQGRHDTLLCPCNAALYRQLGCTSPHRSCADNLHEAVAPFGLELAFTPASLNLFMRVDVRPDGTIDRKLPRSDPGAFVLFEAAMDLLVAVSACPQDITPINGPECRPSEVEIEVLPRHHGAG